jgi:hypothetical protein
MFCGHGSSTMNMLYREAGCDAVLCRPGTFHTFGHATLHASCRPCPPLQDDEDEDPPVSKRLGRISCNSGVQHIHGDLNADGILSPREILRLLFIDTIGRFWGAAYQNWADVNYNECELTGISCVNGEIYKIDLTGANMCSNGDRQAGPIIFCEGIPSEIGELSSLEVLHLSRRQFLRGTLPTEFGMYNKTF